MDTQAQEKSASLGEVFKHQKKKWRIHSKRLTIDLTEYTQLSQDMQTLSKHIDVRNKAHSNLYKDILKVSIKKLNVLKQALCMLCNKVREQKGIDELIELGLKLEEEKGLKPFKPCQVEALIKRLIKWRKSYDEDRMISILLSNNFNEELSKKLLDTSNKIDRVVAWTIVLVQNAGLRQEEKEEDEVV